MCCSYLEYFESVVDFPVALLCFDFPDEVADLTLHKGPVVEQSPVDIQDEVLRDTPLGKLQKDSRELLWALFPLEPATQCVKSSFI